MLNLLGEHPCRIDAKGRLMFPAKLRKQLDGVIHHGLVVNRDIFEGCLVLYPKPEWDKVNAEMARLSRYNRKHQLFQRKFMKGATHVDLDGSGRINLPSALLAYAGINPKDANEVIVSGLGEKVEIWNQDAYNKQVIQDEDNLDFGLVADRDRVPDLWDLVDLHIDEMGRLFDATGADWAVPQPPHAARKADLAPKKPKEKSSMQGTAARKAKQST